MFPELFRDDVFRIETRRLWLRWPSARDEGAIERLAGDEAVAAMTRSVPHPYPKGGAGSFIYGARVENAQGSALNFALAPVSRPHEMIGFIGLRDEAGAPTLGYWLGRPHWGRGLMSEAVDALVGTAFRFADLDSVTAQARIDNPASRRVLEKSGFAQTEERVVDCPLRGGAFPSAVYLRMRDGAASHPPRWRDDRLVAR